MSHADLPTIVLGATEDPSRYAHMALTELQAAGHTVVGVHPRVRHAAGVSVFPTLSEASTSLEKVDTISMYVGAPISSKITDEIIRVHPRRVIFNPGSENPPLAAKLSEAGIEVVQGCTLVMLRTKQF